MTDTRDRCRSNAKYTQGLPDPLWQTHWSPLPSYQGSSLRKTALNACSHLDHEELLRKEHRMSRRLLRKQPYSYRARPGLTDDCCTDRAVTRPEPRSPAQPCYHPCFLSCVAQRALLASMSNVHLKTTT